MLQITLKQKITVLLLCLMTAVASQSVARDFSVRVLVEGLSHPWAMAFLPDGSILVTERPGRLRRIHNDISGDFSGDFSGDTLIRGLPSIRASGQGGLLDVVLHPEYDKNGWIYFSYSGPERGNFGTEVGRARLPCITLARTYVFACVGNVMRKARGLGP